MNVKCLNLEPWMKRNDPDFNETIEYGKYTKFMPVFRREGRYKLGNVVWFELEDGTAYLCPDSRGFDYDLMMADAGRLSKTEINALEAVVRVGLASIEQKRLLGIECDFMKRVQLCRNAKLLLKK